jgi:hypothetical protein
MDKDRLFGNFRRKFLFYSKTIHIRLIHDNFVVVDKEFGTLMNCWLANKKCFTYRLMCVKHCPAVKCKSKQSSTMTNLQSLPSNNSLSSERVIKN